MPVADYDAIFDAAGREWDVDPTLLRAVAHQESGGRRIAVSSAGAQGIMQIMPDTQRHLGVQNPNDPEQSIFGGAKYLNEMLDRYKKPELALAAYNAGPDRVDEHLAGGRALPNETLRYVPAVTAHYQRFSASMPMRSAPASSPKLPGAPAPASTAQASGPAEEADDDFLQRTGGVAGAPASGAAPTPTGSTAGPAGNDTAEDDDAFLRRTGGVAAPGSMPPSAQADAPLTAEQMRSGINPRTGRPLELLNPADPNDPTVQSMGRPIDDTRLPGPLTQAAISLPTDPAARRRVAAAQLFPDLPPAQAQSRLFQGPGGRLAAVDQQGNPFYVDPEAPDPSRPSTLAPSNLLANVMRGAGPSLPAAGGLLGGLAAGPSAIGPGIALAGAGAAGGDMARQYAARTVDPSPGPVDPLQTAKEAGLGAVGQAGGAVINKLAAPNILRVPTRDLQALRAPNALDQITRNYDQAAALGVDLTPGQASGMRSLLQYEDHATNNPAFTGQATDFYRTQGQQLEGAGNNLLDSISPVANKTEAAQQFQQGADDAITAARRQANAAARPSYDAAQGRGQVMSPDLAQLMDQPAVGTAMDRARVTYRNLYRTAAPDTPDFRLWDLTKRSLDDMHGAAIQNGDGLAGRTAATGIDSLRRDLLTHLDAAYPQYATARATAAPGQQLAARLEDSGTGTVAGGVGAERAKAITGPIFGQNPQAISESRAAFQSAGRTDEWQAGVRAHLQDAFEKASMSQQGLNPSMPRRQVWGNADNRDAMQAAMTPQQFAGFDNFMQTVENVAQTYPMNSLTEMRRGAGAALQDAGADQANVKAWRMAGDVLSPFRLADLPGKIVDAGARRAQAGNVGRIMDNLFSPEGQTYLREMAAVSPGSQRAIAATSQLMARTVPPAIQATPRTGGVQDSPNFMNSAINPLINKLTGSMLPTWQRPNLLPIAPGP